MDSAAVGGRVLSDQARPDPAGAGDWRGWVPDPAPSRAVPGSSGSVPPTEAVPSASGPTVPQPHVDVPVDALPVRAVEETADLWLVGAHGGSGESTLAALADGWAASGHCWPELPNGVAASCVVVARTNVRGLLAARTALTQWAASGAGSSVRLIGLVLVADAPGKLPPPLRDLATVVGGGAPRVWEVPWVEGWRLGDTPTERVPRSVSKLVSQLRSLAASTSPGADSSPLQ